MRGLHHQRDLLGSTSASQSTVSGDGVSAYYAGSSHTVTVTAKTSSGSNRGTGGDHFYVQVSNECTKTDDFTCTVVSGAYSTLSSTIFGKMTDNGDGTYTYNYQVNNSGKISVSVFLYSRYYYWAYCFDGFNNFVSNLKWNGARSGSINYDWGSGYPFCSGVGADYFSIRFETLLYIPTTGTYTFYLEHDDGANLSIGTVSSSFINIYLDSPTFFV